MKKLAKKPAKKQEPEAPEAPETLLIDQHSGQIIRVFDLGAVFGVEKSTGSVDLIAKDRARNAFRRSGSNIVFSPMGFDTPPADSAAYVTIEEVEDICTEVTEQAREHAKSALTEDERKQPEGGAPSTQLGRLEPPKRD